MNARLLHVAALGLLVSVGSLALAQVPAGVEGYDVPGEGTFPEGIAFDASAGTLFVGGAMSGAIYGISVETGEATVLVEPGGRPPFTTLGLDVDGDGKLWVAGGSSGTVARYDVATGALEATWSTPEAESTFINDVFVAPNGDVFATDSNRPMVFRVPVGSDSIEAWLDLRGTPFEYRDGVNANGIVASADGAVLLIVALNTGALYRVDVASRTVTEVAVDGGPFPGGDGLVLDGQRLYVAQQGADVIAVVDLASDFGSGSVATVIEDPEFVQIATMAQVGDSLVVVNTQFGSLQAEGGPALPFRLTVVPTAR